MKKLVVIVTGGTIAMKKDPTADKVIPTQAADEFLKSISLPSDLPSIEVKEFSNVPGPCMDVQSMWELRNLVKEYMFDNEVVGIVITHGTDTLEETAYLLQQTLPQVKSVVLVGAMRSSSDVGWDGAVNLKAALRVAMVKETAKQAVVVVMNEQIFAADDVLKSHTSRIDAFEAPEFGPLGIIDEDKVIYYRKVLIKCAIDPVQPEYNVDLIKVAAGMDDRYIRCSIEKQAKGIVVEAMGRGNVPPKVAAGIKVALNKGIKVVIVSRCQQGQVKDVYGYKGAGHDLIKAGAILGSNLSGQKARLKLMLALGANLNDEELVKCF